MTSDSAAGCLSAGLSAEASSIVLAFADIAMALPSGASAGASCALALAIDGGIPVESLSALSATKVAFLAAEDFSAALPDFR